MAVARELGTAPISARQELISLTRLGLPLAAASLGQTLLNVTSSALVGRLGALELGALGIASSIYFAGAVLGMGVVLGFDPIFAQAVGSGDRARAARALAQTPWLSLALGIPIAVLVLLSGLLLERVGLDAGRSGLVREYLAARAPGIAPYLAFVALRSFLQAGGNARSVFTSVAGANAAMLLIAPPLVLGLPGLGLPSLGVAGAGIAETLCTLLQLGWLLFAARRQGARWLGAPRLEILGRALWLGAPVGLQLLAEFGVFTAVNVAVALLDPGALAAHHVAITLASTAFMIPVGVGAAASVRVGQGIGRGDVRAARLGGALAMLAGLFFMLLVAAVFLVVPGRLALAITSDQDVVRAAVPLLAIAAVFQGADGVQAVAAAALRGAGDTRFSLYANLVGHYLVGMPLGMSLAHGSGLGARGLWWGLAAGLTCIALALAVRFVRLTARPVQRV